MILKNFLIHLQETIEGTNLELLNEFEAKIAGFEDGIKKVFETSTASTLANTQEILIRLQELCKKRTSNQPFFLNR